MLYFCFTCRRYFKPEYKYTKTVLNKHEALKMGHCPKCDHVITLSN